MLCESCLIYIIVESICFMNIIVATPPLLYKVFHLVLHNFYFSSQLYVFVVFRLHMLRLLFTFVIVF